MPYGGGGKLPAIIERMRSAGAKGAHLFFLIAIFFAFLSNERNQNSSNPQNDFQWIISRFFRILPLFYLSTVISLIWRNDLSWVNMGQLDVIINIVSHFSFTYGLFPKYCNNIIDVSGIWVL